MTMDHTEYTQDFFEKLWQDEANKECFECKTGSPNWASVSLGVFICIKCAAIHRGLGTHLTYVKSLTLDIWKEHQLQMMKLGGNTRAHQHFKSWLDQNPYDPDTSIAYYLERKYSTDAAEQYRRHLKHEVNSLLGIQETPQPSKPQTQQRLPHQMDQRESAAFQQQYKGAKAISSDELFGNSNQQQTSCCCCVIL